MLDSYDKEPIGSANVATKTQVMMQPPADLRKLVSSVEPATHREQPDALDLSS